MLVFHAGPHKTATSYLQENLRRARRELERRGWCYPHQGTGGAAGHHDIVRTGPEWLQAGGEGRRLLARVPRDRNLVFSAEGAARWAPERYHALADLLGKDQIDVVHALRDPIDLFQSHWIEQIKQGQTYGLADRMAAHFADPWSSGLLNPLPVLQALNQDPRIRLHVIPFELLKAAKTDIFEHFCATVLGLEDMVPSAVAHRNVAMPILQTEFLRLITLLSADGARRIESTLRHRFIAQTTEAERRAFGRLLRDHGQAARRMVNFPAPLPFKLELERQLRGALAGCWTHDPGETPLFGSAPQSYVYYDAFGLMQSPEIVAAAERLLDRLAAGGPISHGLRTSLAKIRGRVGKVREDEARDS